MAKRRAKSVGAACPACDASLPAADGSGSMRCGRCGISMVAAWFKPFNEPGPRPLAVQAGERAIACAQHANNLAVASCGRCGAFVCQLCRIEADELALCPGCFDRLSAEGALNSAAKKYRNYNGLALHIGFLGLLLTFCGFGGLLGPVAVIFAIKGDIDGRKRGEHFARAAGIIGALLGVLAVLFNILVIFILMAALKRI
jgi:hypothetical protein